MKITNKAIKFTVDTVNELLTITGEENQVIVVSDENRGGTFIYRSAKSAVNDGGVTFNGWCRQYSGAVNVKWFGDNWHNAFSLAANKIVFEKKIYDLPSFSMSLYSNLEIDFNGATLQKNVNVPSLENIFEVLEPTENVYIHNGKIKGNYFDLNGVTDSFVKIKNNSLFENVHIDKIIFDDIKYGVSGYSSVSGYICKDMYITKCKQISSVEHVAPTIPTKYLYSIIAVSPAYNINVEKCYSRHCNHLMIVDQSYGSNTVSEIVNARNNIVHNSIDTSIYSYAKQSTFSYNKVYSSGKDGLKVNLKEPQNSDYAVIHNNYLYDACGNFKSDSSAAIVVAGNNNSI